ncbi:MAG: hypothetical protein MZV63_29945 [Marinilabiliales bacterium]|nr:hypothetical protein [Marinilabiliales bacterium]
MLSEVLKGHFQSSSDALRNGMVVIAGVDGYRAAFTLSEIVNRNDQQEVPAHRQRQLRRRGPVLTLSRRRLLL